MRILLVILAAALALPAAARGDTFGVVGQRFGSLVRVDPVELAPAGRRVPLRGYLWGHAWAPDGFRLAVGVSARGRIQIIDTRRMRTVRVIQTARPVIYPWLVWAEGDRLLAWEVEGPRSRIAEVDVSDGSGARIAVRGRAIDVVAIRGGLAALVGPGDGIGEARLVVYDTRLREIRLRGIRAGGDSRRPAGRSEYRPSLAAGGDRLYVTSADGRTVVEVDPAAGAATAHPLAAGASKGPMGGSESRTVWLPGGRLVTGGYTHDPKTGMANPHPVRLVDTSTWHVRTLSRTGHFVVAGGRILLALRREVRAVGLDGRHAWRRRFRNGVSVSAAGSYAYLVTLRPWRRFVVDAATGRILSRRRQGGLGILLHRP